MILTARPLFFFALLIGVSGSLIAVSLVGNFVVPNHLLDAFQKGACFAYSGACVLTAVWLYYRARHRGMIGWTTLTSAGCAWLLLVAAVWNMPHGVIAMHQVDPRTFALLTGFLALGAAPLAAAPLAVAWNRRR